MPTPENKPSWQLGLLIEGPHTAKDVVGKEVWVRYGPPVVTVVVGRCGQHYPPDLEYATNLTINGRISYVEAASTELLNEFRDRVPLVAFEQWLQN